MPTTAGSSLPDLPRIEHSADQSREAQVRELPGAGGIARISPPNAPVIRRRSSSPGNAMDRTRAQAAGSWARTALPSPSSIRRRWVARGTARPGPALFGLNRRAAALPHAGRPRISHAGRAVPRHPADDTRASWPVTPIAATGRPAIAPIGDERTCLWSGCSRPVVWILFYRCRR